MVVFWILLGWIACVVTALAFGLAVFRLLRVRLHWMESVCLGYIAGAGILSLTVLAIAALHLARKGVFLALSFVAVAGLLYFRRTLLPRVESTATPVAIGWKLLFIAGLLAYGTLYFRQALSPEMSPDAMEYHLGLINQFNRAHGLVRFVDIYAGLPEGMEMLYFYAFAIGRNSAAALVHFSFLFDLVLLMALYGKRFGFASAGIVAGLLVFAAPLVGADGTCAFNDVGLAAVMFAAVYLLSLWRNDKTWGLLIACCTVTGFALGVKYTSVFLALFVVGAIVIGMRGQLWRKHVPALAAAAFALGMSLTPYLVRNVLWFSNPVVFFGNSVFRNPYFHISFERDYVRDQAHLHGLEWKDMPLQLTLGGTKVEGCFGAAFLLAPLILAGVFWPQSRFLMMAALAAGFAFPNDRSARFLIPALPLLAMTLAFVLRRVPGSRILLCLLAVAQLAMCWPPLLDDLYQNPGWHIKPMRWRVALRHTPEDVWLTEQSEEYAVTRAIDRMIPMGETVFSMGTQLAKSYSTRKILVSFQSAYGEKLADEVFTTWASPISTRMQWRFRFPLVNAREVRLVQNGRSANAQWSVNEVRLESGGTVRPPGAGGHPYAWPNPWDAALAFDGIEVTRWRTWEPLQPGMRLGVRFDNPFPVDGLTVLFVPEEWDTHLRLQILTDRGTWIEEPPPGLEVVSAVDLRRETARDLKRQGIHYLLQSRFAWRGPEFIASAKDWGLSPVVSTPNYVLFRIE
jgi:hypothetical protein